MPKMKTNSSAKKRFKLTSSGKVKASHARARHLMRKKTKKAKLALSHTLIISTPDEKRVKRLLCK